MAVSHSSLMFAAMPVRLSSRHASNAAAVSVSIVVGVFLVIRVSFFCEESVVKGEIGWPFNRDWLNGDCLVFDGSSGFNGDNTGIEVADFDGRCDPDHDLIGGVGAVKEQDFTQRSGAVTVTKFSSCEIPKLLMLGTETPCRSGLSERSGSREPSGSFP